MCKYCNPNMSYGNEAIYKDDDIDVYITKGWLHLLKKDTLLSSKVKINFCLVCGENLKENHCKNCANYNIGDGVDDIRECRGCEWA